MLCQALTDAVLLSRDRGHNRHEGVSLLNLSWTQSCRGNHEAAASAGEAALRLLLSAGNRGTSQRHA